MIRNVGEVVNSLFYKGQVYFYGAGVAGSTIFIYLEVTIYSSIVSCTFCSNLYKHP